MQILSERSDLCSLELRGQSVVSTVLALCHIIALFGQPQLVNGARISGTKMAVTDTSDCTRLFCGR